MTIKPLPPIPGGLWRRLVRGTSWTWIADRHRSALPNDLDATAMTLQSQDRYHAKQGRSTSRVRFEGPHGSSGLSVYVKRHDRLPWHLGWAALVDPHGRYSPAAVEWSNLQRARALGIPVPEVVAAGERIGPWGRLQSFLMVAELSGWLPMHEAIPTLAGSLDRCAFDAQKRRWARQMAAIAAALHRHHLFHKDLYLCHFFAVMRDGRPPDAPLCLIDLHRLKRHRWMAPRWRWKDLGQLLFSSWGVVGVTDWDRLRFWVHYRRDAALRWPRFQRRMVGMKAARYQAHHRKVGGEGSCDWR